MRIAFVIQETFTINNFNGIRIQAETWAEELTKKGHTVIKVNSWERYNWNDFDAIHLIGALDFLFHFVRAVSRKNAKIVFSPIIDTIQSVPKYWMAAHLGCNLLRLGTPNYNIRRCVPYIQRWSARSKYEAKYINKAYGVPREKIDIVPLSYRIEECETMPKKESFCLHVSIMTDERKNVLRLMKAAIKYKFNLVVAGGKDDTQFAPFKELIDKNDNVQYLGRVSDDELKDLYRRAKVFALPSINEGVGMVAVEAASYGCDIVVTEIGGPKEYYPKDMAQIVNPYDIDEIGKAVLRAMNDTKSQPLLMDYIKKNYNISHCVDKLLSSYDRLR